MSILTKRYCNRCHHEVIESGLEEYAYQCKECDEDLYEFETYDKAVFVIQFSDETDEETSLDNDAYTSYHLAEAKILEWGYEKKVNWNNKPFYEKDGHFRYASILKLKLIEPIA